MNSQKPNPSQLTQELRIPIDEAPLPNDNLNQAPPLEIQELILIEEQAGIPNRFVIRGTLKNNGTDSINVLKVSYREYQQQGEELVEVNTGEMTVNPQELRPNDLGNFGRVFTQLPTVILIDQFSTEGEEDISVNYCYANSLVLREMCRRQLNTSATFPFDRP
ncbi:MAG: hypothetical protein ACFBSC_16375 [Microcoleaceae cyanobacterium]